VDLPDDVLFELSFPLSERSPFLFFSHVLHLPLSFLFLPVLSFFVSTRFIWSELWASFRGETACGILLSSSFRSFLFTSEDFLAMILL